MSWLCICSPAQKLAADAGQYASPEEIEKLIHLARERFTLCPKCVDAALSLCAALRAELEIAEAAADQADSHDSWDASQSLCQSIVLLGSVARCRGLSQVQLQRFLSLIEPPKNRLGVFSGWLKLWLAVIDTLRELACIAGASEAAQKNRLPLPPPHVKLRGGGLCGTTVESAQKRTPFMSSIPDTAETVRKHVFADQGVTLGAWVFLHTSEGSPADASFHAVLWRFWEPQHGGWELVLREKEVDTSYLLMFVPLGARGQNADDDSPHHGNPTAIELAEVTVGSLPMGCWLPLIIEIQHTSDTHLRLGGSNGEWVKIDMGVNSSRSQFPPPGHNSEVAAATRTHERLVLFEHVRADLAGLWLFAGVCGDEVARWLQSLFAPSDVAKGIGAGCSFWTLCSDTLARDEADEQGRNERDELAGLETDLLENVVLGYLPGYHQDHELVNYCVAGSSVGSNNCVAAQACSGQGALRIVDGAGVDLSCALMTQLTAPGWLGGMLWALARALPALHVLDGISGQHVTGTLTQVLNAVFDFVAAAILCAGRQGRGSAFRAGRHFFVEDGGFAVWSYVLRCHVSPTWLDESSMRIFCNLVEQTADCQMLSRDCWAQLFGPHMASFWRAVAPCAQRNLWTTLFRHCSVKRSYIGQLGGVEWVLFELSEHVTDLDVSCIKLLLVLAERDIDFTSILWPRVLRFVRAPAAHARAVLAAVRSLVLPGVCGDPPPMSKVALRAPEAAAAALSALSGHQDEGVRISALAALQQLESATSPFSAEQLELLCTRFSRQNSSGQSEACNCTEHSYVALWAWMQCQPPPRIDWDESATLDDKVRGIQKIADCPFIGTSSSSSSTAPLDTPAMLTMRSAGSGRILVAVIAILDGIGNDDLCLRFLLDYKLLIGWAGDCTADWWDELKPHCSIWHTWLLRLVARKFDDDAYFLAAAKLHTMIVSSALTLDASAWFLVEDLIRWSEAQQHQPARATAVCRTLLVQLLEAVQRSFEVQLRDAAGSFEHPLCANLLHIVTLLDDFLLPSSKLQSEPPAGQAELPAGMPHDARLPAPRLLAGSHGAQNPVWLDFLVAAQLVRLWAAFIIRDPLQKKSVLGFDLGTWMVARWGQRRPFPLDGVTEQVLFGNSSAEDPSERFLFTRLMHWGTRCLRYRGPSEADLSSQLGRSFGSRAPGGSADKSGNGTDRNSSSTAALAASAVSSELQLVQIRREILLTLRHLTLCLLAVGSHASRSLAPALAARPANAPAAAANVSGAAAGPGVSSLREDLGVAIVCFCAHASSFDNAWREAKGRSPEARGKKRSELRQEAKGMMAEAAEYAADVLLLLMLLCCQKWGRPAAGFSEQDLRACADTGEFPCTVLRLLPRLQWDKVATDLRDMLAKQPGPKAWLGATTPWMDPMATMQGSLFSFVFSPVNGGVAQRRGGVSRRSAGGGADAAGASSSARSRDQPTPYEKNVVDRWAFREAVKASPLVHAVWDPMEAPPVRISESVRLALLRSSDESMSTKTHSTASADQDDTARPAPVSHGALELPKSQSATASTALATGSLQTDMPAESEMEATSNGTAAVVAHAAPKPSLHLLIAKLQKVVQRANVQCRRLQRQRRGWTAKAWRSTCRANRAPGSVWHCPESWVHPSPPPGLKRSQAAGSARASDKHIPEDCSSTDYCNMWRRNFAGSTAAATSCRRGRHWSVQRLEDSSHRRVVMRQSCDSDALHDSSTGSLSNSSSSFTCSDSEGSSGVESCTILQAQCTWIRREGNHPCTLRLGPNILQLHIHTQEPSQVESRTRRSTRCVGNASSNEDAGGNSLVTSDATVTPVGSPACSPAASPVKSECSSRSRRSSRRNGCARPAGGAAALEHRGGRIRRFRLRDLHSEGVHPRRFLHRHTALELHFLDGASPVRLHFDDETPAPWPLGSTPELPRLERAASAPASSSRDDGVGGLSATGAGNESGALGTGLVSGIAGGFTSGLALTGGLGHGLGSASAAATALLSRTTEFWGGKPTVEATTSEHRQRRIRQGVASDISLRDEVWLRIVELQQRLQESSAVCEKSQHWLDHGMVDMCWFRSAGCTCYTFKVSKEAEQGMNDSVQPLKQADVQRLHRLYQSSTEKRLNAFTLEWQQGQISNFGFLQSLNILNGRSLEDLSQYPIFPWVLRDLRHAEAPSVVLGRDDPKEVETYFRDLSKTLGDLGCPERRSQLQEKYLQAADPENRPYHYGTHYSTPAFVMHFLIRVHPFTDLAQALQGGKFDVPDRIFYSLPESWRSCMTEMSDVRELTPELFSLPECLLNLGHLDFGARQDGQRVDSVELPPWAQDAYHFVHEHRLALESKPVSRSLHQWIDLVWGYKQSGEAAIEALNVFFPLTYEDGVDWSTSDPIMRHSKEQQILHFGQTPSQIFTTPAPARDAAALAANLLRPLDEPIRNWHSSAVVHITAGTSRRLQSWAQAPVVAIGAHSPPGEPGRLYVILADGSFSCYRLRSSATQPLPTNNALSLALSITAPTDLGETAPLHVDLESKFPLPDAQDCLRELMLQQDLACKSMVWSFLPECRFFARGGYRDGSVVFGLPKHASVSVLKCAHAAAVSALALSRECARHVPDANGLLLLTGDLHGAVGVWAASDGRWRNFDCVGRWQVHLEAVRCVDFDDQSGLALSAGEDGLVQVYRLRPGMRPLRTFLFADRLPVTEARFGSRAPASIVACASFGAPAQSRICVWALHGFLLATFELPAATVARGLRAWSDGDAQEALFYSTSDGHVELRSLPYLKPIWRRSCRENMWPVVSDCAPAKRLAWFGHEDGSFEVVVLSGVASVS